MCCDLAGTDGNHASTPHLLGLVSALLAVVAVYFEQLSILLPHSFSPFVDARFLRYSTRVSYTFAEWAMTHEGYLPLNYADLLPQSGIQDRGTSSPTAHAIGYTCLPQCLLDICSQTQIMYS